MDGEVCKIVRFRTAPSPVRTAVLDFVRICPRHRWHGPGTARPLAVPERSPVSARTLARSPGVALALVLTIALGIGSNAAVHGFVRGLMSRHLPLPAAETVVSVFAWDGTRQPGPVSHEEFLSLRSRRDIFEQLGAARESEAQVVVAGLVGDVRRRHLAEIADILQLPAARGVVVSHRLWQTQLGAAADVRGHSIRLDEWRLQ